MSRDCFLLRRQAWVGIRIRRQFEGGGLVDSTLRRSSLDIFVVPATLAPQATPMDRHQVKPSSDRLSQQGDVQEELCVPAVALSGESYRLREAKGVMLTAR